MNLIKLLKKEFSGFNKKEVIVFSMIFFVTIFISFLINDSKIALVSALCGLSYTILAGKGKVSCYFIGMIGTFCYCYISFLNGFYGNLLLYGLYYFPMEIIGIFQWKKHLKKDKQEIIKTKLKIKERIVCIIFAFFINIILFLILKHNNDKSPYIDSFTTAFSILGQYLTVKRCIEQWYLWFFVNLFSLIMWIIAYLNGSNCFVTIIMWLIYLILSIYFLISWKKELNNNNIKR